MYVLRGDIVDVIDALGAKATIYDAVMMEDIDLRSGDLVEVMLTNQRTFSVYAYNIVPREYRYDESDFGSVDEQDGSR